MGEVSAGSTRNQRDVRTSVRRRPAPNQVGAHETASETLIFAGSHSLSKRVVWLVIPSVLLFCIPVKIVRWDQRRCEYGGYGMTRMGKSLLMPLHLTYRLDLIQYSKIGRSTLHSTTVVSGNIKDAETPETCCQQRTSFPMTK